MARPRRRFGRLILCTLLLFSIGFAAFHLRRRPPPSPVPAISTSEPLSTWRARAGETRAFSDTLGARLETVFTGLGIGPEKIRRARSKREAALFETTVEVPKDLPLAVCNLEISRLAEAIGGGVIGATEALGGVSATLQVGLGGKATDRILLQTDSNTTRPAGAVALIICATADQDAAILEAFCDIEQAITLALWPGPQDNHRVVDKAVAGGHGIMLHLRIPDPREQGGAFLRKAMVEVPEAGGVVNDLADGRPSEDERTMGTFLAEVRRRGLYFVDGRASGGSAGYRTALKLGVRCGESAMRVDEEEDPEAIRGALGRLADLSGSEGLVFGTAYARPGTLVALREALPLLERRGVRFVRAEQIVRK